MTILEQVMQMKNQGVPDEQIISNLQQQGISPKEINDSLSQAEIKNAVSGAPAPSTYEPMAEEQAPEPGAYEPQEYGAAQEEYYPQESYGGGYEQGGAGVDSNTIMEIAEQVFEEKIKKIEKKMEELNEFKSISETKIENVNERLKKIESMIDKLQITILEKVGSYGKNLDGIKKEMSMMQDSFGKMINPLMDKKENHTKTKSNSKK